MLAELYSGRDWQNTVLAVYINKYNILYMYSLFTAHFQRDMHLVGTRVGQRSGSDGAHVVRAAPSPSSYQWHGERR
jgi:hypothetical protein